MQRAAAARTSDQSTTGTETRGVRSRALRAAVVGIVAAGVAVSACSTPARPASAASALPPILAADGERVDAAALVARLRAADIVLLGEVHDHPLGHRARLELLRALVQRDGSPALVMEHFDVDRQAELDAARRASPDDVDAWVKAAAPAGGWPWPLLRPVLELARDRALPVIAANLPRVQARAAAEALDSPLAADAAARLRRTLVDSHCGMLTSAQVEPLVRAQQARDRRMAEVLVAARAQVQGDGAQAVLLAGNGHVRGDFGVPAYLGPQRGKWRVVSVGFVERDPVRAGADEPSLYDYVVALPPHPRDDPCAAMRRRAPAPQPASR